MYDVVIYFLRESRGYKNEVRVGKGTKKREGNTNADKQTKVKEGEGRKCG